MLRGTPGLKPALRDEQQERPACLCGRCMGEVWPGETLYRMESRLICPDCFAEEITTWLTLSPQTLADSLGIDHQTAEEGVDPWH